MDELLLLMEMYSIKIRMIRLEYEAVIPGEHNKLGLRSLCLVMIHNK